LSGNTDGQFAGRGGSGRLPLLPLDGNDLIDPTDGFGLLGETGLSLYGRIGENMHVLVNALQKDTNFKVLSRPTIYTSNSQKGLISAGRQIAVPTNSYQGGVNTGISTNVQYRDVFLTLEVIPLVNSEDEVTLQISLVNEELGENRQIDDTLTVPDILSRQILTTVTVPNGSTIALGGLISTTLRDSVSGIPFLSQIPGLGRLFSTSTKTEEQQELMVFIQPTIVKDAATLYRAQADLDSRYEVADESRGFAAGPAVLPERGELGSEGGASSGGPSYPVAVPVEEEEEGNARRFLGRPTSAFRRR
jgi:type II secretory pathway component GspD/PulD (secretin)